MGPQTEAACLLETGALYGTRVMLCPAAGDPVFAGFKQGAFSLYYGDAPIFHFDREGRWQRAYCEGLHYRKGLDTNTQTIDRVREGENLVLKRRTLPDAEVRAFDARVRATARELLDDLNADRLARVEPPSRASPLPTETLRAILERIASWDDAAWDAHRALYRATYGPLPFLPPDCPNAVILQATVGHRDGRAFGQAPAFKHAVRTPDEFDAHARAVAALYGRRLAQCRTIFLGGSDVLRRPVEDVSAYLASAARYFPIDPTAERRRASAPSDTLPPLDGVHAFLDDVSPSGPDRDAWRRFRQQHLLRVSLGVESGLAELRGGPAWSLEDLVETVAGLKEAEIGVNVLTMYGPGGVEQAGRHLNATVDLIKALPLAKGDIVYLLDADEFRDPALPQEFTPLGPQGRFNESAAFTRKLGPIRDRGVKVIPYSLEKQGTL